MPLSSSIALPPYAPELFVDRDEEIALTQHIIDQIRAGSADRPRTVVFRGERGSGKTWLALHLQRTILPAIRDVKPLLINFYPPPTRHAPRDDEWFTEELPGVGHKTASVVLVQAFGRAAFPVDTHIHRLAARWGLSDGSSVERTERDLKAVFPEDAWGRAHLAIILFGREHCPARGHDLSRCPICSWAASKARIARESTSGRTRRDGATTGRARPAESPPASPPTPPGGRTASGRAASRRARAPRRRARR